MPTRKQLFRFSLLLAAWVIGSGGFARTAFGQTAEIQEKVSTLLQRKRLEGTWRPVSPTITHERLIFKGNTFERRKSERVVMKATYEINATKKPMTMDLKVTEPAGTKVEQVYKIEGDRLWIVTGKEGRAKDVTLHTDRTVAIYERQYTKEQLMQVLARPIEMKNFAARMSMKEFVALLSEMVAGSGKSLPVVIDTMAFKQDDPSAPNVLDTSIQFQPGPARKKSISTMLHAALGMFPVGAPVLIRRGTVTEIGARGEPALIIRDGEIVITTRSAASGGGRR